MNDKSDNNERPDDGIPEQSAAAPEGGRDGGVASEHAAGDAGETAVSEVEAARAEAAELRDKLLRTIAELENFRRRAERERQDVARFAISNFARDCLSVVDNLRRGLESIAPEDRANNAALETLAAGMELTEREMLSTLERHGIQKVDPLGEPFNHDVHQAMFEVENPEIPAGVVVQVAQAGYLLNGRLLRPAMVGVSKGGPKLSEVQARVANESGGHSPEPGDAADAGPEPERPGEPAAREESDAESRT